MILAGGGVFLTQHLRPQAGQAVEDGPNVVKRRDLEIRDNHWYLPGQTNGFCGIVIDAYGSGERKSRSSVSNGLLEGLSCGWYTNGQLQVEEHFRGGVSHGLRTKWYANGRKLSEVSVARGKMEGLFRRWYENGQLAEEVELKAGLPDGLAKSFYSTGFKKSAVFLREGAVVRKEYWKDGETK